MNSVHTLIRLSPTFKGIYRKLMKRIGKNRAIIAIARKLAVAIFNMLSKNQHFVDDHAFKALYERKLKNMESRKERAHEFNLEDMEKIIGRLTWYLSQQNFFHGTFCPYPWPSCAVACLHVSVYRILEIGNVPETATVNAFLGEM